MPDWIRGFYFFHFIFMMFPCCFNVMLFWYPDKMNVQILVTKPWSWVDSDFWWLLWTNSNSPNICHCDCDGGSLQLLFQKLKYQKTQRKCIRKPRFPSPHSLCCPESCRLMTALMSLPVEPVRWWLHHQAQQQKISSSEEMLVSQSLSELNRWVYWKGCKARKTVSALSQRRLGNTSYYFFNYLKVWID